MNFKKAPNHEMILSLEANFFKNLHKKKEYKINDVS